MDNYRTIEATVIETRCGRSLLQVARDKFVRWISALITGSMFKDSPAAVFLWRWVTSLYFIWLTIGAMINFYRSLKEPGTVTGTSSAGEVALHFLSNGCEYFFHYIVGAPRIIIQKFLEALLGISPEVSLVVFQALLASFCIAIATSIWREWRREWHR